MDRSRTQDQCISSLRPTTPCRLLIIRQIGFANAAPDEGLLVVPVRDARVIAPPIWIPKDDRLIRREFFNFQ